METVKRFMTLRVKSDKEYATLLLSMTQQTEKQEATDYVSTVSKVSRLTCPFSPGEPMRALASSLSLCPSVVVSGGASD